MLLSLKDDALFNKLVSLDAIHNSSIDAFLTFSKKRAALTEMLPGAQMEGFTGTTALSRDQMLLLRPKMVEVNGLIEVLREQARRDYLKSAEVLEKLNSTLKTKLGLAYKLEMTAQSDASGTQKA